MTNREKRKVLKSARLVHLKYENNKTRVVEIVEPKTDEQKELLKNNPDLIFGIQLRGHSKSGLSKSRQESKQREENIRTFDINKIIGLKEIKASK